MISNFRKLEIWLYNPRYRDIKEQKSCLWKATFSITVPNTDSYSLA
jgi:hypothetical protein